MHARSTTMSNLQFWTFTIGLIAIWFLVINTQSTNAFTISKDKEVKNGMDCRALCKHCGCLGFYCGEECICECNNDRRDTDCLETMQNNARSMNVPFEVLIQGPSSNSFVRNALQYEYNKNGKSAFTSRAKQRSAIGRNKRSTVVIYKPAKISQQNILENGQCESRPAIEKGVREKRDISQLNWFNDLTNSLVRPVPLNTFKKVEITKPEIGKKRAITGLDRSWFTDSATKLLRPAPIGKRDKYASKDMSKEESDEDLKPIEKIPRMIENTIRNLQEAAFKDEKNKKEKKMVKNEKIKSRKTKNDDDDDDDAGEDMPLKKKLPDLRETIANMKELLSKNVKIVDNSGFNEDAAALPKVKMPFFLFRPARFLERVQEAIH